MIEAFELGALDARVHIVWGVVVLLLLGWRSGAKRRAALQQFGVPPEASAGLQRRRGWRLGLTGAGLIVLTFAALQPRANPRAEQVTRKARDLAICLDVSRSMLADDMNPNRLEHAKLELARLADHLTHERVGLVLFAGEAVVRCPLTSNYSYFKRAIGSVSPTEVSQGGTHIGDAIRKALDDLLGFDLSGQEAGASGADPAYADVLVLTDGEDHESYPIHAAKLARGLGVGVFAVGLGSREGRTIPLASGKLVEFQGQPVRTKLDDALLTEMVSAAGRGRYLPVATQHFDLVDFYEAAIRKDDGRVVEEQVIRWTEVYQPFVILGLLLLLVARAIPLGRAPVRRAVDAEPPAEAVAAPRAVAAAALVALTLVSRPVSAEEPATLEAGQAAFAAERFEEAAEAFEAVAKVPGRTQTLARYDAGVARRRAGQLDQAIAHFEAVAVAGQGELAQRATYHLGSIHFEQGMSARAGPADATKPESLEEVTKRLGRAATELRAAVAFFERVQGEAGAQAHRTAKVRLRQTLDALLRALDEQRKEEARQALADPARFLLQTLRAITVRRRLLPPLAARTPRSRRVGCRRLAQDEQAWRERLEKLRFGLAQPVQPTSPATGSPGGTGLDPQQREAVAKLLGEAIESSRAAEGALRGLNPAGATAAYDAQAEQVRAALVRLPLDLGAVTAHLLTQQGEIVATLQTPGLHPKEEGEVAWLCQVYAAVQASPPPAAGSPPGQGPIAPLTSETAAAIRAKGKAAQDAATQAHTALSQKPEAERAKAATPHAEAALARLRELAELLPKPPPSLVEKVQELLGQEREAAQRTRNLERLSGDAARDERQELLAAQAAHAGRARALAQEARQAKQPPTDAAAKELETAAKELDGARGALEKALDTEAAGSADRAVAALERALAALQGKQDEQQPGSSRPQRPRSQDDKQRQSDKQRDPKQERSQRLDPAQARAQIRKLEQERREAEKKLFPGGGGRAVEKDW